MSDQCQARVYYRDVARYTGRTASGFEREWAWRQCKRRATKDDLCAQHAAQQDKYAALVVRI